MIVKDLVKQLLDCEMDAEISIKVSFKDEDMEHSEFEIEETNYGKYVELVIDLEEKNKEEY